MIIPFIQVIGVGISATFGLNCILRVVAKNDVSSESLIIFGIGMAMATCGLFFN
jgi:hypothetical protein